MPSGSSALDIRHVAALARLTLTPDEEALFSQQLAAILDYADRVKALDTTGVPPMTHVLAPQLRERDDAASPSLSVEAATGNAPDAPAGVFRVPRVLG